MLPWEPREHRVPVVARNPATGEQVRVDISHDLREAIRAAIRDTVSDGRDAPPPNLLGEFTDRTLLHGAAIDGAFGAAAVLCTLASPNSTLTKVLWVVTAVLAAKTLLQAAEAGLVGRWGR